MPCFGCSRRASNNNFLSHDIDEDLVKTGSLTKKKKKNSFISWPRFWTKKSDAKTVPVDISMSGSLDLISNSNEIKVEKKNIVSAKKHRLPIGVNAINNYKRRLGAVKEIIENHEITHLNSLAKEDKYDKKKSSRKKETTKKTRSSKSSSPPENKNNPGAATGTRVDEITSLPPQKKEKLAARENGDDIVSHEKKERSGASDSNSMIGLSVIIVILLLMLFFGKLYAILCASAWFYMIPRLKTAVDSNVTVNNELDSIVPDLNSEEHKKKVVLEGLLQRNQRNIIRIL